MKTRRNCHGFTVVELMISLGVVAILLTTAVPGVSNMIKDNRLAAQLNAVVGDIHMARSEAGKRGVRIIMCRSADPNSTTPSCSGSAQNWTSGYLVFTGEDGNNTYDAGTDTLLRRSQPAQQGVTMRTSSTWNNNLEINATGALNEAGTAIMALCDDRGNSFGRQVTIPLSGSLRMYAKNISDCAP